MPVHQSFQTNSLVLYKTGPARVISVGAKIEIELDTKKRVQVRNKDIVFLHKGPVTDLSTLNSLTGEVEEAREILYGESPSLEDLAEMVYGEFTPSSAWGAFKLLEDGLHFFGTTDNIQVRSLEEYEKEINSRQAKVAEKEAWSSFVGRVRSGKITGEDHGRLKNLEDFANGKSVKCRILKELNIQSTPEHAHRLLLKLKLWDNNVNPYVPRMGFSLSRSYPELDAPLQEKRLDLTHLDAFAIDDEGNKDPDDAISIDGDKLWIHVADVASLIKPGTPADLLARDWGASSYLPEKTITMLPPETTGLFGLGLEETSPSLSFCISLDKEGHIDDVEIHPALVKVTRMSYLQANERMDESPFKEIFELTRKYGKTRKERGGVFIKFPEVKIRVIDGVVVIRQLPELDSKKIVLEAMLMAGEAAAKFAIANNIPFLFTTQPVPDAEERPEDMAGMFAFRKKLKPSQIKSSPGPHAGLGLDAYSRATSPLRRYVDLVAHQQIRAFLNKGKVMDEEEILSCIGAYEAIAGSVVKLERSSNLHWTLVYLLNNPGWQGTGIVAEKRDRGYTVIVPEIGMEARIGSVRELALNETVELAVAGVDLPGLRAQFRVL